MNYALVMSGSSFTIGVVEDDPEPLKDLLGWGYSSPDPGAMELSLSLSQLAPATMATTPECHPVMAATPEPLYKIALLQSLILSLLPLLSLVPSGL